MLRPGLSVLELAPTKGLHNFFRYKLAARYVGVDIDPAPLLTKGISVNACDLCADDINNLGRFDIIVNSHVMEHLRCDAIEVIGRLSAILKAGGVHLISVPFAGDRTIEDLSPDLSPETRLKRFGHPDHVRAFGHVEFPETLRHLFGSRFAEIDLQAFQAENEAFALGGDAGLRSNRLFIVSGPTKQGGRY
jgi:SAM-dependent methyltransferase